MKRFSLTGICVFVSTCLVATPALAHPGHGAIGYWHHVSDFGWPLLAAVVAAFVAHSWYSR